MAVRYIVFAFGELIQKTDRVTLNSISTAAVCSLKRDMRSPSWAVMEIP